MKDFIKSGNQFAIIMRMLMFRCWKTHRFASVLSCSDKEVERWRELVKEPCNSRAMRQIQIKNIYSTLSYVNVFLPHAARTQNHASRAGLFLLQSDKLGVDWFWGGKVCNFPSKTKKISTMKLSWIRPRNLSLALTKPLPGSFSKKGTNWGTKMAMAVDLWILIWSKIM